MNPKYGDDVDYSLYNIRTTELVCANHIEDDFIKKQIRNHGSYDKCDYCSKRRKVVELSFVLELIIIGIDYLFEDPANSRFLNKDSEYGFDGNNFHFFDIWINDDLDLRIDDPKLSDDILKYLGNDSLYCRQDEFGSENDFFHGLWSHFKEVVKHRARFVFYYKDVFMNYNYSDPLSLLKSVQYSILKFDLITELNQNTILYRCRQHEKPTEIKDNIDMASAPIQYCKQNGRMNPAGIAMFYCSRTRDLTVKEVVNKSDKLKPYYSTVIFRNKEPLRLVDLTKLPGIGSIFDKEKNVDIDIILFLEGFLEDISKPVKNDDTTLEYVPTQIITEYIRFNPKLNVDGIIYPSSKIKEAKNIVLFLNHEESLNQLNFSQRSIKTFKI